MTPGLRIGKYEVGARLGKGSFGVVHLAVDVELGREVAIKFLRPEFLMRDHIVQRFIREARAAAKIGHPGIVTVFECGQVLGTNTKVDGTAYIVMERLGGESLGERIAAKTRFDYPSIIAIGRQLATALQAAHAAGIIHRDLKPDARAIASDSVYQQAAVEALDRVTEAYIDRLVGSLDARARAGDCSVYVAILADLERNTATEIRDEITRRAQPCNLQADASAAVVENSPPVPPSQPPTVSCSDTDAVFALEARGDAAMTSGQYASALQKFDAVYVCTKSVAHKAYLAACRARAFPKAKFYFQQLGGEDRFAQICLKEGYDPRR